jgi:hypothetical protein
MSRSGFVQIMRGEAPNGLFHEPTTYESQAISDDELSQAAELVEQTFEPRFKKPKTDSEMRELGRKRYMIRNFTCTS